jgi:phosphoglycerate dehydrogenase-like enzyme
MSLPKVAILDDYQGVALQMADWSALQDRVELAVFHDHLSDIDVLAKRLAPFDIVCVMRERTPLQRNLLNRLPNLKLVVSTGARNASIDLAAAAERRIVVCATGYVGHGAAELTWALILAAAKHIPQEYASVRNGGWQTRIGRDLHGRTLGIAGLGNLGAAVARCAHAFNMNVIAWSTNLTESKAREHGASLVSKEQLLEKSDILTIHLVLSARTKGILGARELALMKPSAILVNTSRGPLVDESALIDVLQRRAIAGAALDVFDTEPLPPDHPFRRLGNVIATPHIGYVTEDTYRLFYRDTVECILAWLDGSPIRRMN